LLQILRSHYAFLVFVSSHNLAARELLEQAFYLAAGPVFFRDYQFFQMHTLEGLDTGWSHVAVAQIKVIQQLAV
jgi:hypothetical protein